MKDESIKSSHEDSQESPNQSSYEQSDHRCRCDVDIQKLFICDCPIVPSRIYRISRIMQVVSNELKKINEDDSQEDRIRDLLSEAIKLEDESSKSEIPYITESSRKGTRTFTD